MSKDTEMDDIENVGIMQGFLEEEEDDLEEEGEGDEENSAASALNRRPNSPEILMNNLRGDMRSVDARREELADLVGYAAAAETPDSVLAMLQPVLAQQGGLGALPQSGPMAQGPQPPMGGPMPPMGGPVPPGGPPMEALVPPGGPPMPPGGITAAPGGPMPPMGGPGGPGAPPMPPIGMKDGGLVQRFQDGSDEEGVTPAEDSNAPSMSVTPEMLEIARAGMTRLLSQQPAAVPDLRQMTKEREKLYGELLGEDKNAQQAQLLFALAQRGLQLAGNVDARGRPLVGSPLSRFATVASDAVGDIGQFISDADKRQSTIRMAALQAAEKEAEQVRAGNIRTIESQRKFFGDVLRSAGRTPTSVFGKGSWEWSIINTPGLLQAYVDGETTPDEDNLIVSAATKLTRPTTEYYTDDQGRVAPRQKPGYSLPFLDAAMAARARLDATGGRRPPATPGTVPASPTTDSPELPSSTPEDSSAAEAGGAPRVQAGGVSAGERAFAEPTLWNAAQSGIGLVPKVTSELARSIPIEAAGEMGRTQQQAASTITKLAPRVTIALRETARLSNAEREDINLYLNLEPRFFENRIGYLNNLVSLGQVLYRIRNDALDKAADRSLSNTVTNEQRFKARDIQAIIDMVGIPPIVSSLDEYRRLPLGAEFLVYSQNKEAWVPDRRKPLPDEQ